VTAFGGEDTSARDRVVGVGDRERSIGVQGAGVSIVITINDGQRVALMADVRGASASLPPHVLENECCT
jgi:hypothetical protein